ncbi:hypothetical protein [Gemmata sp.]|uniref:hypothetical protein n=1 Tax=Gemmata sp. TaxID=1914242 RepID=UPI003F70B37C
MGVNQINLRFFKADHDPAATLDLGPFANVGATEDGLLCASEHDDGTTSGYVVARWEGNGWTVNGVEGVLWRSMVLYPTAFADSADKTFEGYRPEAL